MLIDTSTRSITLTNILTVIVLLLCVSTAQAQTLFVIPRNEKRLATVDPSTGQELSSVPVASKIVALAFHPLTNQLFALTRADSGFRQLSILDPVTGVLTHIGDTGLRMSDITFDCNGVLYGVTGDGQGWQAESEEEASLAESLFTIDLTNGTTTFVQHLGNGSDGENIAYNPDDGLIYHVSGFFFYPDGRDEPFQEDFNSWDGSPYVAERILETVDTGTGAVTSIDWGGQRRMG